MTIDITPEAVEQLAVWHGRGGRPITVATLRALSAALTASQAETAAAYYVAALVLDNEALALEADVSRFRGETDPHHYRMNFANAVHRRSNAIRALTFTDSKAALDVVKADAEERGMRKAVGIVKERIVFYAAKRDTTKIEINTYMTLIHTIEALDHTVDRILADIPKGKDHE